MAKRQRAQRRRRVSLRAPATASKHAKCSSEQQPSCSSRRDPPPRRRRGELRRIGHRIHYHSQPSAAEAAGIASLTRIVDRQTNRQIADELFVSTKTVETHIRNIFGTLSADSRIEVARIVEQADRVAASNR